MTGDSILTDLVPVVETVPQNVTKLEWEGEFWHSQLKFRDTNRMGSFRKKGTR